MTDGREERARSRLRNEAHRILVTGGSGFLGSHFIRAWLGRGGAIMNLDP